PPAAARRPSGRRVGGRDREPRPRPVDARRAPHRTDQRRAQNGDDLMGQRTVKRVPLDFDWPIGKVWDGYLMPESLRLPGCPACDGRGWSPHARHLHDRWYGYVPFDPAETGCEPLTRYNTDVRALAYRNVANAPGYYGTGEAAVDREA